jgi:hypothetical protein
MFRNTYQNGFLSILYSIGSKPLRIWDKQVKNGHIKRLTDSDIQSSVLEIMGTNVSTTFVSCPIDPRHTLAIKLPFLVMIIKNVSQYLYTVYDLAEKVLYIRSYGPWWQEHPKEVPCVQLSTFYQSPALHLYYANALRRRLEPNSV